jgi:hypothetical protein
VQYALKSVVEYDPPKDMMQIVGGVVENCCGGYKYRELNEVDIFLGTRRRDVTLLLTFLK